MSDSLYQFTAAGAGAFASQVKGYRIGRYAVLRGDGQRAGDFIKGNIPSFKNPTRVGCHFGGQCGSPVHDGLYQFTTAYPGALVAQIECNRVGCLTISSRHRQRFRNIGKRHIPALKDPP
ncbi:MAG: hypothetical protein BWY09_02261 [Candidatus Hydrogenedentes bacterium ADurb.Bin179]|nr:MAG: hypothetical protein BWY09_02261 [Candidatus Hydrogenedentes bacterium ADurb.Bin179]